MKNDNMTGMYTFVSLCPHYFKLYVLRMKYCFLHQLEVVAMRIAKHNLEDIEANATLCDFNYSC